MKKYTGGMVWLAALSLLLSACGDFTPSPPPADSASIVSLPTTSAVPVSPASPALAPPTTAATTPVPETIPPTSAVATSSAASTSAVAATSPAVSPASPTSGVAGTVNSSTPAVPPGNWKEFVANPAGFSILLPPTPAPTEKKTTENTALGPIETYQYTLELSAANGIRTTYSVIASTYPTRYFRYDDTGGLKTLEEKRNALVKSSGSRGVIENGLLVGEGRSQVAGRELLLNLGSGTVSRTRLLIAGATLYQLQVRYISSPAASLEVNRFFGSFRPLPVKDVPPSELPAWPINNLKSADFSIALPEAATETVQTETTLIGPVETRLYILTQPNRNVKFSAGAINYPTRYFNQDDPGGKKAMDEQRQKLLTSSKGKLVEETPITYDRFQGREVLISMPGGGYLRTRMYVIGTRLYQLGLETRTPISSPSEAKVLVPTAEEVRRFFLSFAPAVA